MSFDVLSALQCLPQPFKLKFHLVNPLADGLKRLGNFLSREAALLERFSLYLKQACGEMSRRFHTRMNETSQKLEIAREVVQRPAAELHGDVLVLPILRNSLQSGSIYAT